MLLVMTFLLIDPIVVAALFAGVVVLVVVVVDVRNLPKRLEKALLVPVRSRNDTTSNSNSTIERKVA